MNKFLTIALVALTATLSFSQENSQENELKLGVRHGFNLHNVFWKGKPPGIGFGFGGGIAGVIPITSSLAFNPEVNFYYRNVYNHRLSGDTLFKMTIAPAGREMDIEMEGKLKNMENMTEFALGIPLLLQFTPVSNVPFYIIGGVLFTVPIKTELECEFSFDLYRPDESDPMYNMYKRAIHDSSETMNFKNRSKLDIGVVLGGGYYITKHFAVDFRGSVDLTNISSKKNDRNIITVDSNSMPILYNFFRRDKTWLIQYGIGISYFI